MRQYVEGGLDNCKWKDATKLLHVSLDSTVHIDNVHQDTLDLAVARMYDLEYRTQQQHEHDYADTKKLFICYKKAMISYISGCGRRASTQGGWRIASSLSKWGIFPRTRGEIKTIVWSQW